MATGARQCKCGKKLRSDNKSGRCVPCNAKVYREGYKDRQAELDRQRYLKNREAEIARTRAWYFANHDQAKEMHRRWRENNPDKTKSTPEQNSAQKLARLAKKRRLFVEAVYRSVVWRRDGGICHLCGRPADLGDWHLDHVISLAEDGPHCYANVAVSHPLCNKQKRASSRSLCGVRWSEATAAYKLFHDREYSA